MCRIDLTKSQVKTDWQKFHIAMVCVDIFYFENFEYGGEHVWKR